MIYRGANNTALIIRNYCNWIRYFATISVLTIYYNMELSEIILTYAKAKFFFFFNHKLGR